MIPSNAIDIQTVGHWRRDRIDADTFAQLRGQPRHKPSWPADLKAVHCVEREADAFTGLDAMDFDFFENLAAYRIFNDRIHAGYDCLVYCWSSTAEGALRIFTRSFQPEAGSCVVIGVVLLVEMPELRWHGMFIYAGHG